MLRRDFCDQTELLARMKACVEPLHEKVECTCQDGFATKTERDMFVIAEAKYHADLALKELVRVIGQSEAKKYIGSKEYLPF